MNTAQNETPVKFCKPCFVQRMTMTSKNSEVRFSERFEMDYMGNSYFERGDMWRSIRAMNGKCGVGVVMVDGVDVFVAFNTNNYNLAGIQLLLTQMYYGQHRMEESTYFNREYRLETARIRKTMKNILPILDMPEYTQRTDSWFDIEHGLFWTMEKINIKDIVRNIRFSVAYMDAETAKRQGAA